jgi:hypothetical protein
MFFRGTSEENIYFLSSFHEPGIASANGKVQIWKLDVKCPFDFLLTGHTRRTSIRLPHLLPFPGICPIQKVSARHNFRPGLFLRRWHFFTGPMLFPCNLHSL